MTALSPNILQISIRTLQITARQTTYGIACLNSSFAQKPLTVRRAESVEKRCAKRILQENSTRYISTDNSAA